MRRYLSDSQLDDDEIPDQRKHKKKVKRKISRDRKKRLDDEHKTKEDAFDDWAEAMSAEQADINFEKEFESSNDE